MEAVMLAMNSSLGMSILLSRLLGVSDHVGNDLGARALGHVGGGLDGHLGHGVGGSGLAGHLGGGHIGTGAGDNGVGHEVGEQAHGGGWRRRWPECRNRRRPDRSWCRACPPRGYSDDGPRAGRCPRDWCRSRRWRRALLHLLRMPLRLVCSFASSLCSRICSFWEAAPCGRRRPWPPAPHALHAGADGGEVGEHTAEPAGVHRACRSGWRPRRRLLEPASWCLTNSTVPPLAGKVAHEGVGGIEPVEGLLEVDDVDIAAICRRCTASSSGSSGGLMPEVRTGIEQRGNADFVMITPFVSPLPEVIPPLRSLFRWPLAKWSPEHV